MKLILPMIDKSISLEDLSNKSGFVDAYTLDINRPYLTDYIFLLYKRTMEPESVITRDKLSKLPCLHSKRNVKINNILYVLYCFTTNSTIKLIKNNGYLILPQEAKIRIGEFWKFTDVDITDFLLGYAYMKNKFEDVIVPEEDFSPKDFITYDEKREELVISSSL